MVHSQRLHPADCNRSVIQPVGVAPLGEDAVGVGSREPRLRCVTTAASTLNAGAYDPSCSVLIHPSSPLSPQGSSEVGRQSSTALVSVSQPNTEEWVAAAVACGRDVNYGSALDDPAVCPLALYDGRFHSSQNTTHVCGTGLLCAAFPGRGAPDVWIPRDTRD